MKKTKRGQNASRIVRHLIPNDVNRRTFWIQMIRIVGQIRPKLVQIAVDSLQLTGQTAAILRGTIQP
jgi:hypothetical protein